MPVPGCPASSTGRPWGGYFTAALSCSMQSLMLRVLPTAFWKLRSRFFSRFRCAASSRRLSKAGWAIVASYCASSIPLWKK